MEVVGHYPLLHTIAFAWRSYMLTGRSNVQGLQSGQRPLHTLLLQGLRANNWRPTQLGGKGHLYQNSVGGMQ